MHLIEGLAGIYEGVVTPIPERGLSVGKLRDNDLVLEDPYVSREHARFLVKSGSVYLQDLRSTNGTFVNDVQVHEQLLRNGDRVQIGGTIFRYRDRPAAVVRDQDVPGVNPTASVVRSVRRAPEVSAASVWVPHVPVARSEIAIQEGLPARAAAALVELAKAKPGSVTLEESLERILALVFEILPVDRGCIVLMDEDGTPVPHTIRYRDPSHADADMPLSRTLLRGAVEQGSALLIADALADQALAGVASIMAQRLRCVAYVPICFADQVLGVICVESGTAGGLREPDLDTLVAFANQAALVTYQARLQEQVQREFERRTRLMRFMAKAVAEEYLGRGEEPHLGGEEREITILFADLRNYTGLSEHLQPKEALSLLNTLFERLCEPVLRHRGTLDKYIGDCIMAIFGAPQSLDHHCLRAVQAAMDMQAEMKRTKAELAEKYGALSVGIAINTGTAVVGLIGTEQRMDYTAIGDAVNVAARVEDLAGPGEILVTESVARRVEHLFHLRPAHSVQLRGRKQSTEIFELQRPRATEL